jgi:hypothetical protein
VRQRVCRVMDSASVLQWQRANTKQTQAAHQPVAGRHA